MSMNDIITNENKALNIDRLAAQRKLYSKAKNYSNAILWLCVIVPIAFSFAKVVAKSIPEVAQAAIIYSFFATFLKYLLSGYQSENRNLASRIQQLFDCELFHLEWNEALCGAKPIPEEVYNAQKGASRNKLENWYEPIIATLSHDYAVLVCQRTNVVYDHGIRKSFGCIVNIVFAFSIIIIFTSGLLLKTNMWNWFLNTVIPMMPIIAWYLDLHKQNKSNLSALNKLQTLIDGSLIKAEAGEAIETTSLQNIQNFMYMHRNTSYTIPDWVYKMKRDSSEAATYYSAEQLCNRLNHQ